MLHFPCRAFATLSNSHCPGPLDIRVFMTSMSTFYLNRGCGEDRSQGNTKELGERKEEFSSEKHKCYKEKKARNHAVNEEKDDNKEGMELTKE